MGNYEWNQLSMWDTQKEEYYVRHCKKKDNIFRYMLVLKTEPNNDGYFRSNPVKKNDVTDNILSLVGNP